MGAVCLVHPVVQRVDDRGDRDPQVFDALGTDLVALRQRKRVFDRLEAARRRRIEGVRLLDVDEEELDVFLVLIVDLGQPTG